MFDGERVLAADSLRVRDGHVVDVGEGLQAANGEATIDAQGGTVLPGFIDAHTHSWGEARTDALRFGVTTVVDMFTMASMLPEARESRETPGPTRQADLFSAGTLATVKGGHGTQFGLPVPTVDSDDDVVPWVRARIEEGSDFIKIVREDLSAYRGRPDMPSLEAPRAAALVQAAHAEGLKAVVHVAAYQHAVESLDAGADGLVHVFQDAVADDAFAQRAARQGLFVVPTLTVVAGLSGERSALADDAELGPRLSGGQKQTLSTRWPWPANPGLIANARANVTKLHAAGVRILAGTDAPNANTAHGASLHEELVQLVDAGLSPVEALAAATAHPADAFGLDQRGRIAPGMRADLVLVAGRPDQDIRDTRGIRAIWKNGHPVPLASMEFMP
ncbi:amidohydrolase family protein [Alkalisalibacterium limincola]|uniref:amidohydrolase family protein n=1 Tax=Alkalisalibacterium limincola TaxID=2699169 RepID=UPI0016503A13|nr:amidohydrolase family protein [Alkalisalibacterium limincola]